MTFTKREGAPFTIGGLVLLGVCAKPYNRRNYLIDTNGRAVTRNSDAEGAATRTGAATLDCGVVNLVVLIIDESGNV